MLVVLRQPCLGQDAVDMVLSAVSLAKHPLWLRFLIPAPLMDWFERTPDMPAQIDPYDTDEPLEAALSQLDGVSHFLLLGGAYGFSEGWDAKLYAALRPLPPNAVLTACIRPPEDAVPPIPAEACLPGLADQFEDDGVLISRGLPLVCAAGPVRTLIIDPALVFGTARFLREVTLTLDTLSIAAYVAGFVPYALDSAPLWPLKELPRRRLRRPVPNVLPGTTLSRFEQLAGFRYDQRRAGVRTTWGLFDVQYTYAQRMPQALMVRQRIRDARMRLTKRGMPLLVSAFVDLPSPRRPVPAYVLRFGFLKAVESLALLLYTGGSQERVLRASFPNTQSYPDNSVLPRALLQSGMSLKDHFRRSKPLLLQKAAKLQVEFTHAAWVDADILPHPICPDAVPDFSPLMDERIHLATVDGVADLSFFVVPTALLPMLCREILSITQLDEAAKRGFSELALWERLFAKYSDRFTFHPMPRRRMLFFTAFEPQLLGHRLWAALLDLEPPVRPEPLPPAKSPKTARPDLSKGVDIAHD